MNLSRVSFVSVRRTTALVSAKCSTLFLEEVYASNCIVDLSQDIFGMQDSDSLPGGLILATDLLQLSIQNSVFKNNQLLVSTGLGLAPAGGSCVYASFCRDAMIHDSIFVSNRVTFILPPSLHPLPNNGSSLAQTFEYRSANSLPKESHRLHGGAVLITDTRNVRITKPYFESNNLSLPYGLGKTYGGSISVLNSLHFDMVDFYVMASKADIGGGIYLGFVYLMHPTPYVGFSSFKMSQVTSNSCTRFGCGIAIESASEIEMYLHNTEFHSNKLFPTTEPLDGLVGGVAAAFVVSSPHSLESLLEISTVQSTLNSMNSGTNTYDGGVTFLIDGVLHVTVQNTIIRNEICGPSCIWIRRFRDIMWNYCIVDSVFNMGETARHAVIDIGTDYQFYLSPDYSITFLDSNFTNIEMDLIKVFDVESMLITNAFINNKPMGFGPRTWPLRALNLQNIRSVVEIHSSTFKNPGSLSFIGVKRVQMMDSHLERNGNHPILESPWLITTSGTPLMRYQRCTFDMKGNAGAIKSVLSLIVLQESVFRNGYVYSVGGAIFQDQGSLVVLNTTMENCTATSGGAIFTQGVDLNMRDAIFKNNHASLEGGAIRASSTIISRNTHFTSNTVDSTSGKGGAIYLGPATSTFIINTSPNNRRATPDFHYETRRIASPIRDNNPSATWFDCSFPTESFSRIMASTFTANSAASGGAIWIDSKPVRISAQSTFISNNATFHGGAIGAIGLQALIENSLFESNYASPDVPNAAVVPDISLKPTPLSSTRPMTNEDIGTTLLTAGGLGGAIFSSKTTICLYNSTFSKNAAEVSGGALFVDDSESTIFSGLTLEENIARNGGAATLYANASRCQIHMKDLQVRLNGADYGGAFRLSSGCEATLDSSIFDGNWAVTSGGAIYIANSKNTYPTYSDLQFIDNSAGISGGTWFHNVYRGRWQSLVNFTKIDLCSANLCTVSSNPDKTRYIATWGPLWAASAWNISSTQLIPLSTATSQQVGMSNISSEIQDASDTLSMSTSSASVATKTPARLSLFAWSYKLHFTFEDFYGQRPTGSYPIDSTMSYVCLNTSGKGCPFLISGAPGVNEVILSVNVLEESSIVPGPYNREFDEIFHSKPEEMQLVITLNPTFDDAFFWNDLASSLAFRVSQRTCPVGEGLHIFDSQRTAKCYSCPTNSYNIDGNGYCYTCNGPMQPPGSVCEGSHVSFVAGHWSGTPPNKNDLFLSQCAVGLCGSGRCAQHHTGFMCDSCVDGSYKSIFSSCHPILCKNKSISLAVLFPFAAAIFVALLHMAVYFRPGALMFILTVAQLALVPILPYLDWSIPKTLPSLAEMLCGSRMDAMQRSFVFAFGPLLALPVLWILGSAYLLSLCAGSKFRARGRSLHWRRLLLTTFALLYLSSTPALYASINWLKCKKSIFGTYWSISPSISCDSEEFQSNRNLMLGLALPLWIVPLGASFAFLVIRDVKKWPTAYGHRADILPSLRIVENLPTLRIAFHFLNGYRSRWWAYIDLLILRLLVPILSSTLTFYGAAESTWTSIACTFAMLASTFFQPFLTRSMRFAATAALAGVASLTATQPDLSARLTYPFIALGLVSGSLLLLILIFALGAPSVEKSQIEAAWDQEEEEPFLGEDATLM